MKASDYVAISALIVSLISAWISIQSWRFNVKVKSLELRAFLLTSLHNALFKVEIAKTHYALCEKEALEAKQVELIETFQSFGGDQKLDEILKTLRREIQQVENISGHKAIKLYQRSISRITGMSLRVDNLSDQVTALKTAFDAKLSKAKGSTKNHLTQPASAEG